MRATPGLVWTVILSQFGPPFMFSGVAVALPAIAADLDAGASALGLVETLFLAGSVAFLLPAGKLADAVDRRALYRVGLLAFGLSSLLVAVLPSIGWILPIRFVQGAASALAAVTGTAVLADLVPPAQRGRAFGRMIGTVYAGLALGPVLAGLLVDAVGWRAVFAGGGCLILLGWLLVAFRLPARWNLPRGVAHVSSTALLVGAAVALFTGSAMLHEPALGSVLLAVGFGFATWFLRRQWRSAQPLLDLRWLLGNRVLRSALLVQAMLYMAAFSAIFLLSLYVQVVLGRSAREAGQVLAVGSIAMVLLAPFSGAMADRFAPARIARLGVAGVALSALLAATLHGGSGIGPVVLVLALHGLGFALFSSPNTTTIMNSVTPDQYGTASALGAKSRSLGMAAGMLLTTVLISVQLGNRQIASDPAGLLSVLVPMFALLAAITALALLFTRGHRAGARPAGA